MNPFDELFLYIFYEFILILFMFRIPAKKYICLKILRVLRGGVGWGLGWFSLGEETTVGAPSASNSPGVLSAGRKKQEISLQKKKNNLDIGQCCKTWLPPKLDRGFHRSLPLEKLPFLLTWFLFRRSHCSQTTKTNLQLHSQLNK